MTYTLALLNKQVLFYEYYKKYCKVLPIYKDLGSLAKLIRLKHLKYKPDFKYNIWFGKEFANIKQSSSPIIIFDSPLSIPAANYLKRKFPNQRVIYWFWNHLYNIEPYKKIDEKIEKWSYDPKDCMKYNLRYNTQFYFDDFSPDDTAIIKWDFLFIGAEKGRGKYIQDCLNVIEEQNLSANFIVSGNSRKDRINNWIEYPELIKLISQSRCIVDIVPDAQKGLTLRPLEALFLKKKLLTNFTNIADYNFYNPDNIFIIGKDKKNELNDFLNQPLVDISQDIVNYYSFPNWLNRFNL